MKKFALGCLVMLVIVLAVILLVVGATSGLPKAANAFFAQIQQGNVHKAYLETAAEFRAATTEEAFAAFLDSTALDEYQSALWFSRSIKNNTGRLQGTVTTRDGGKIPVSVDFVKENGTWKILAVRKSEAGIVGSSREPEIPPDSELERLTQTALADLGKAINDNDFSDFHRGVSELWKSQTDPEALRTAFESFIEKGIDLTPLGSETPIFSKKPIVDENGVLVLEGYFPTQPDRVNFVLKFIYEHPQWRLVGVNVNL